MARAAFTFRDLPRTGATLMVEIRDARGPVTVVADGVIVGRLESGVRAATFPLAATGRRSRVIELWSEPFRAGDGRLLGALLGRVAIDPAERDSWPSPAILLERSCPRRSPSRPPVSRVFAPSGRADGAGHDCAGNRDPLAIGLALALRPAIMRAAVRDGCSRWPSRFSSRGVIQRPRPRP
jgi:hypothetical protein